jgi:TRAP-type mannitol/chloroaromatic compound transport system permease large subunit
MTMKGVAPPSVTMLDIFRAVVPFLVMSVLLLALVFLVPAVATWLPARVREAPFCFRESTWAA